MVLFYNYIYIKQYVTIEPDKSLRIKKKVFFRNFLKGTA